MNLLERFYPESRFGGFADVDGTVLFYSRVNSLLKDDYVLLDVGCGRGEYDEDNSCYRRKLRIFKGKVRKVIGVDVDDAAAQNPHIDEFHLITSEQWGIPNNSIDVIICDYVLEHVENPDELFSEFRRVLKPNGILCARTPNLYSYFGLISNLIPDKFHAKAVTKLQDARKTEDVFPKFYNCNSLRKLRKLLRKHRLDGIAYGYEGEPGYFSFSAFFYWMAKCFHSLTPRYFRTQLHLFALKK